MSFLKSLFPKRVTVQELIEQPPRIPTRDAILSTPTRAELAANQRRTGELANLEMGSLLWTGDLRPLGSAIAEIKFQLASIKDAARRAAVTSRVTRDIAAYGGPAGSDTLRDNGFNSLGTGGEKEFDVVADAGPGQVAEAQSALWEGKEKTADRRALARDVAQCSKATTATDVQRFNAQFWAAQAVPQVFNRKFGKG
jgi:hypothetical protein